MTDVKFSEAFSFMLFSLLDPAKMHRCKYHTRCECAKIKLIIYSCIRGYLSYRLKPSPSSSSTLTDDPSTTIHARTFAPDETRVAYRSLAETALVV